MPRFHRHDGHEAANPSLRMPADTLEAKSSRLSIGELLGHYEAFCNEEGAGAAMFPWATRFAMGFPLPSWQREHTWTQAQNERFILSIWCGVDLGSYLVNDNWEFSKNPDGTPCYREFSEALLDGQQRLTCLELYITNQFAVPDASGNPTYWKDIPKIERMRFTKATFVKATVSSWDESVLRRVYDLRAFGGTAHNDSQRASA